MTSPNYKDRIETELQDGEETLLRISQEGLLVQKDSLKRTIIYSPFTCGQKKVSSML